MSTLKYDEAAIDALLHRLCDGILTQAEQTELVRQLQESPEARRRYADFVTLSISLADWSNSQSQIQSPTTSSDESQFRRFPDIGASEADRPLSDPGTALQRRLTESLKPFIVMALAASLAIAATAALLWNAQPPVQDVATRPAAIQKQSTSQMPYVARVIEVTSDADWGVEGSPGEFLMRVRPGETLYLTRGLATLEYYSGAVIILHAPARFEPIGDAAGQLYEGRVSGRVVDGNFRLLTPSAEVIDLGTEFGVSVGPDDGTDVLVFDGEVEVRSDASDPREPAEAVNLTEGMTVRVNEGGRLAGDSLLTVDRFSRRFDELSPPTLKSQELSLVDILCGGSGKGWKLAAAIDPLTGHWDRLGWQKSTSPGTRKGDTVFHASSWHPMIDGTFIPGAEGRKTQTDSSGRTISLPPNHGEYTWGPVWARRFSADLKVAPRTMENDFWGADTFPVVTSRLADSRYGGIGIHASVGITFDLNRIRQQHGAPIESLQAVLTNLDNSESHNPDYAKHNPRTAHFWVLVDGDVRYEQLHFSRNVTGLPIEVPINDRDQKLTLVTTDAGDSNKYDHIVLIDPVLKLSPDVRHVRHGGAVDR